MEDQILLDYANHILKTEKIAELEQKVIDSLRDELKKLEQDLYKLLPKHKCPHPHPQQQPHHHPI